MRDQALKPAMEIVEITPAIAKAWLDQNIRNRRADPGHVARLARDMRNGNFVYTGDPIRFDIHGVMMDGQHRVMAIEKSGVSQSMLVMYGLPPHVQHYIDGGRKRSTKDALDLLGYHNTTHLAALARCIYSESLGIGPFGGQASASTAELLEIVQHTHPQLQHYVAASGTLPKGVPLVPASLCHYVGAYALGEPDLAAEFIRVLRNGSDDTGCPARAFRERCINAYADREPLKRDIAYYTCKRAFNWFMWGERKRVTIIREYIAFDGVDESFFLKGPPPPARKAKSF